MGCGSCSSSTGGTPAGCKSHGSCSTGGCNRLNVFDWLSTIPLQDNTRTYAIMEVSFGNGSRKDFYRNQTNHYIKKGDWISVEGVGGYDIGKVSLTGELVKLQLKKYGVAENTVVKRVLHPATEEELTQYHTHKEREKEILIRSRAIANTLKLDMKLCEVEVQADGRKGTFFYTADQRVDFRELIKLYAGDFRMKVEMRQIGARQESGKVGGIGSCGRELCCSTWLTDFKSVNTTSARYQNLAINQVKLSGQCGRLKCCLNYELDTYMDALSVFPDNADTIETIKGVATLQKRDIFKNLMWYSYSDNNKQYPLTIVRVKEIVQMNRKGQKAEELQPVELEEKLNIDGVKENVGYVNDVGQLTLKSLEKKGKKKQGGGGNKPQQQQGGGGNRPNNQQQRGERQPAAQQPDADMQPAQQKPAQNPQQQRPQQRPQQNSQQKQAGQQQKPQQQKQQGQQQKQQQQGQPKQQQKQPQQGQQQRQQGQQQRQQRGQRGPQGKQQPNQEAPQSPPPSEG